MLKIKTMAVLVAVLILSSTHINAYAAKKMEIYYFYMNACPVCEEAFDEDLYAAAKELNITTDFNLYQYNVFEDRSIYDNIVSKKNIKNASFDFPMLIINDDFYIGEKAIYANLSDALVKNASKDDLSRWLMPAGIAGAVLIITTATAIIWNRKMVKKSKQK